MARRGSTARTRKKTKLTPEQTQPFATRMMAAAQAHQSTSRWCMDKPDANPPTIESLLYFPAVSFELVLLSVEQSLRLMLLLQYSILRGDTNHNPHVLYKTLKNKSGGKGGLRSEIISKMDALVHGIAIRPFSEKELDDCLGKHDSSYSSTRYFDVSREGRIGGAWEYSGRDVQILHVLAIALIELNLAEMLKQGIRPLSARRVPESEMSRDLRALRDYLRTS